jgi:glycosyltransferase involved in cell wall biosynthesis
MRVAVIYSYRSKIGGIESYLDTVIKQLSHSGHDVSFWYEIKSDPTAEQIELPRGVTSWCFEELGIDRALKALREWTPDIIYSHGLLDTRLEEAVLGVAPAVIFVHGYYGTCISGSKTFSRPMARPCDHRFGTACLLNYHVRGCGGLNPLTMIDEYRRQSARLRSLPKYSAIITASNFMKTEFIRNGINAQKIHALSLPVVHTRDSDVVSLRGQQEGAIRSVKTNGRARENGSHSESWRLLFLGRMSRLKGGKFLLDALPRVSELLDKPLRVTFAGEGPDRPTWEKKARRAEDVRPNVEIKFPGWLSGEDLDATLRATDLLVVPSVWPEPFGLVGPEAGLFGVPAAAFDVGGISDWLSDGVNGFLAPGNPPTSRGLAEAIVKCLADPNTYARLRAGAFEAAQRFSVESHLAALLEVFSGATARDFEVSRRGSATPVVA